ncbi:hypothetical protein EYV94_28480 [Puteibacter caeruleilacunae]|nr:hypothetical protein EYV94_28480 [Puteibacter caeruleilacunae]
MRKVLLGFITLLLLWSCEKDDEFYQRPDWLKGSVYEFLQKEDRFSMYLNAIDRIGLKEDFDGKALMTCFIPNNDAFQAYLDEKGYNKVEDIPEKELTAAVRYTMGARSFNREELETYHYSSYPHLKGKYFRLHSFYRQEPYQEKMSNSDDEKTVWLYNNAKTVNFFSQTYFDAIKIEKPKNNIDLLFGEGTWDGNTVLGNGAKIITYEIPTDNGYIYEVDKMTDPLQNIEDILTSTDEFSLFKEVYDYFSNYRYQSSYDKYGETFGIDSLYSKGYSVFNTFDEKNTSIWKLTYESGSLFVPNNEVLKNYLDDKFGAGSSDDPSTLPLLTLKYLIEQHALSKQQAWMDHIQDGTVQTNWGDNFEFEPSNVFYSKVCSNGVVYGLDKVLAPSFFNSVLGPVLFNSNETIFSWIVEKTQSTGVLNNRAVNLGLIVPNNDSYTDLGYRVSNEGYPIGDEKIQYDNNGKWKDVSSTNLSKMMDLHIAILDGAIDFTQEGIVKNLGEFSLFKYKDNKLYVNESDLDELDKLYAEVLDVDESAINGVTYRVTNPLKPASSKMGQLFSSYDDYEEFANLLEKAGVLNNGSLSSSFISIDNYIVMAPSNAAILSGIAGGTIPEIPLDSEEEEVREEKQKVLKEWCSQYFVSMQENSETNYMIPQDQEAKTFKTKQIDKANSTPSKKAYVKVTCTPNGNTLSVENQKTGASFTTREDVPVMIAKNGVLYSIDGLF